MMTLAQIDYKNPSIENFPLDRIFQLINTTKYMGKKEYIGSSGTAFEIFETEEDILNTQSNKEDKFVSHSFILKEEALFLDHSVQVVPKNRYKIIINFKNVGKGKLITDEELLLDS